MKSFTSLVVSTMLGSIAPVFGQSSLQFDLGGPASLETARNEFIFSDNGVTATANAWSVNRSNLSSGFAASQVVQWSPGLGVKNSSEAITDTPYVPYYVDNQDHYDFVLFVFSKKVDVTSVRIHPSAGTFDLDATFWLGNVDTELNLTGDVFADLSGHGFGSRVDNDGVVSSSPRTFGITSPTAGVNAMLIGARVGGDSNVDRFKITTLHATTVIPEPSSFALIAGSLALGLLRRRR